VGDIDEAVEAKRVAARRLDVRRFRGGELAGAAPSVPNQADADYNCRRRHGHSSRGGGHAPARLDPDGPDEDLSRAVAT